MAIVEDHPDFRASLCDALGQSPQLRVLEVCKDLPAGLQCLERCCPDVLLVDLGLPSGSGLLLIREAQRRWGRACTSAVLTVGGNEEHLLTAVQAGAKGYVFKSDQASDWLQTVHLLAQGQSPLHAHLACSFLLAANRQAAQGNVGLAVAAPIHYETSTRALLQHIAAGYTCAEAAQSLAMSPAQAGLKLRQVYEQLFQRGPELSGRELELLTLLNKGIPFKKCADLMGVSDSTTKTLAARAYQKLGAGNLQTALYEARAANLIA